MNCTTDLSAALIGKSLLIFDFDGTVADTSYLHAIAFSEVLAPLGITVNYSSIAGLKTLDAMHQCLIDAKYPLNEKKVADLVIEKQKLVRQLIRQGLQALPGVDDFLRWAQPRYKLAMVTSGSRETVNLALARLGYNGLFDPLICADDVLQSKPNPEGFLTVLTRTGVSMKSALIFEDSEAGFSAATAAGIDFCDVRDGCFSAWHCG